MESSHLSKLLENITGFIQIKTPKQEKELNLARQKLAASLLRSDDSGASFLLGESGIYSRLTVSENTKKNLSVIAANILKERPKETQRAYVRYNPALSPLLTDSQPAWAAGIKPAESFGPFLNADGRNIWFDFYPFLPLKALYMDGRPVIFYQAAAGRPLISGTKVEGVQMESILKVAGSVWLSARLFLPDAATDAFIGMKAESGFIYLSKRTTVIQGKTTIAAGSHIAADLKIKQEEITNPGTLPKYGKDGATCNFKVPDKLFFFWNGSSKKITKLTTGDGEAMIYGKPYHFTSPPISAFAAHLAGLGAFLGIPLSCNEQMFEIRKSDGRFIHFSGEAPLAHASWIFPQTTIEDENTPAFQGSGGIGFKVKKGIRMNWTGLENQDARLSDPEFILMKGGIVSIDEKANLSTASQHIDLWKVPGRAYSASLDMYFQKESTLIAVLSGAEKNETLQTSPLSDIQPDRPVEVSGEAVGIRQFPSSILIHASENSKKILLIARDPTYNQMVAGDDSLSIALENALFKMSRPIIGILSGNCSSDFKKISDGSLFYLYSLYAYLPTLPDPYLSSIGMRRAGAMLPNQALISAVSFRPGENGEDLIDSEFMNAQDFQEKLKELSTLNAPSEEKEQQPDPSPTHSSKPIRETVVGQAQRKAIRLPRDLSASSKKLQAAIKLQETVKLAGASAFLKKRTDTLSRVSSARINLEQIRRAEKEEVTKKDSEKESTNISTLFSTTAMTFPKTGISEDFWDKHLIEPLLVNEMFSLLDISSNANQMGVSLGTQNPLIRKGKGEYEVGRNSAFALKIEGMELKYPEGYARTFMLPQIAWEPAINLTPTGGVSGNPELGPMFYANDGGPSRIWNNNNRFVTLAPIPLIDAQIKAFKEERTNLTLSAFTLPFGLKAVILSSATETTLIKGGNDAPEMDTVRPKFQIDENGEAALEGGIQISLKAGSFGKEVPNATSSEMDSPMFPGYTAQLTNLLNSAGNPTETNNLGQIVATIFNNEFLIQSLAQEGGPPDARGVPLSRMDMTGYGANIFSNWLSPTAAMAQTSQAKFDVMHGRTAHEVIQVKSILYPWGIRVVRTITLFKTGTAYIMRTDSGWVAESDGLFDFSYRYLKYNAAPVNGEYPKDAFETVTAPYELHPGVVKGLFNIRNIVDAPDLPEFNTSHTIKHDPNNPEVQTFIDGLMGRERELFQGDSHTDNYKLSAVYFDADVEIENVIKGQINEGTKENNSTYRRVVSKRILGYVQLTPAGIPLHPEGLTELLNLQNGKIGGPLDCTVNVNKSYQQMLLSGFDFNPSVSDNGNPIFVIAARGTMVFPKAGSWSVVRHDAGSGEVTPISQDTPIPLIRIGEWVKEKVIPVLANADNLLRIAEPLELLRTAGTETINLGFLQTTSTQKALFLTPAFGIAKEMLLSKTPPIFADGYRLMMGETIFPNIGDAITNFGNAMPMFNALNKAGESVKGFVESQFTDGNKKVLELLEIIPVKSGEDIIDQGVKLLQGKANEGLREVLKFDIPPFSAVLVETEGLKIYAEYDIKEPKSKDSDEYITTNEGRLEFDIDSFAEDLGDTWLSRANNMSMVVDLGSMKRLITISGNFDAAKGKDTGFQGNDSGLPYPDIRFSKELQPVVDLLQVLGKLSQGEYGEAMKKGLQVAMSNKAELWEYKFEATKDLPTLRFPPTDELYNSAQTPLRLEATMSLGVYFNAALKVTTDPKQLLPTAGAFLKFHGGMEVMCASVGVGSVYAIGSVDVLISCDTKKGPGLTLDFGFGVSIVVSLPVVGNASVSFLIGVSMKADLTEILFAALMRFEGRARIAGGLVGVTIFIEAKGIVKRSDGKTESSAQVTFGLDISVAFIINISFSKTWGEDRQIA